MTIYFSSFLNNSAIVKSSRRTRQKTIELSYLFKLVSLPRHGDSQDNGRHLVGGLLNETPTKWDPRATLLTMMTLRTPLNQRELQNCGRRYPPCPMLLSLREVPIWSLRSALRSVNDVVRVFHPASSELAVLSSKFDILDLFGPGLPG